MIEMPKDMNGFVKSITRSRAEVIVRGAIAMSASCSPSTQWTAWDTWTRIWYPKAREATAGYEESGDENHPMSQRHNSGGNKERRQKREITRPWASRIFSLLSQNTEKNQEAVGTESASCRLPQTGNNVCVRVKEQSSIRRKRVQDAPISHQRKRREGEGMKGCRGA